MSFTSFSSPRKDEDICAVVVSNGGAKTTRRALSQHLGTTPRDGTTPRTPASPNKTVINVDLLSNGFVRSDGSVKNLDKKNAVQAMALVGFSAFIYSIQSLNVKMLSNHKIDFWTVTMMRGIVGSLFSLLSVLVSKKSTVLGAPKNRPMLNLRGLLGGITILSAFYAISAMDLAQASVLIFTAPLWTAVFNHYCNGDTWYLADSVACIMCLLGMTTMNAPQFANAGHAGKSLITFLSGGTVAIISAITAAGVNITIRKLKEEGTATITLYAMLGSIVVSLPGFFYHLGKNPDHVLYSADPMLLFQLSLTGFLSWLAQMSKTAGLQKSKDVGCLVMRYLDICFAFLWDTVVLHEPVSAYGLGGGAMIIVSCMGSVLVHGK